MSPNSICRNAVVRYVSTSEDIAQSWFLAQIFISKLINTIDPIWYLLLAFKQIVYSSVWMVIAWYAFNFRRWDRLLQLKKLWYSKLYPKTQKFNNRTQLDKIIKNQRIYLRRIVLNLSTTSNQVRKTIKKVGLMFLAILKMARKSLNQKTTLNLKTTLQSYCQITIVQYRCK